MMATRGTYTEDIVGCEWGRTGANGTAVGFLVALRLQFWGVFTDMDMRDAHSAQFAL